MLPPAVDRPKLKHVAEQISGAIEELLLGGLTRTSEATRQSLGVAIQEEARFRLLRLGSTLRVATEELGRFTQHDANFSARRLTFFLNRAWMLARGIGRAIETVDEKLYDRLTWIPAAQPVKSVDVVCLGVVKKVAANAFVAFEFRLRNPADGQRLTWSTVFPVKSGTDIPVEGYLHLDQKQKFKPALFLGGTAVTITNATVAMDEAGGGRLSLTESSAVKAGTPFTEWKRFLDWTPATALERLASHKPGPLDLDTELQEEIVLKEYTIEAPVPGDEPGQTVYPIRAGAMELRGVVGSPAEGKALAARLDELRKSTKSKPPLIGLMHYERCRLTFQPLATFDGTKPKYLPISDENIDKAALLKAMKFT